MGGHRLEVDHNEIQRNRGREMFGSATLPTQSGSVKCFSDQFGSAFFPLFGSAQGSVRLVFSLFSKKFGSVAKKKVRSTSSASLPFVCAWFKSASWSYNTPKTLPFFLRLLVEFGRN